MPVFFFCIPFLLNHDLHEIQCKLETDNFPILRKSSDYLSQQPSHIHRIDWENEIIAASISSSILWQLGLSVRHSTLGTGKAQIPYDLLIRAKMGQKKVERANEKWLWEGLVVAAYFCVFQHTHTSRLFQYSTAKVIENVSEEGNYR